MNVLVEERCLKDIANAIRKKGEVTTTYKPREMAVAIEKLQTGGSGCLVKIEQSANQKITATYRGKTYTDDFFVLIGESFQTSVKADKYYTAGTVNYNGVPLKGDIVLKATQATEARKYRVIIEQSANQKITATWDGKTYTSTFYAYEGSRITFAVKADYGYKEGTLNYTVISDLNRDVVVEATKATKATRQVDYTRAKFYISSYTYNYDGSGKIFYCKFRNINEEFKIYYLRSGVTVTNNDKFQQFLKSNKNVSFMYNGASVCTFDMSDKASEYDYHTFDNFAKGTEMTVTR